MKILYIVSRPLEINSSASLRNINTVNGLSHLGHEVTVVTAYADPAHPQYSSIKLHDGVTLRHASKNVGKSTSAKFSRVPLLKQVRGLIYRFYSKQNVYDSWKYVVNDSVWDDLSYNDFDIVISSADPKSSHMVAEKVVDRCHLPWVQIWGDPFTGDIASINKQLDIERRKEEKRLLSKATKAFYLSELTCEEMKQKYPESANKLFFMPRPYIEPKLFEPMGDKQSLRLSYCGDYNSTIRNVVPLYQAVCESNDYLTICGNGDVPLARTENITINGRVTQTKVDEIEAVADVLVHVSNLSGTQIPGKLYNYSATNKPILFILDGDCKKIESCFSKYNRYVFCQNNVNDIERAIEQIRNGDYTVELAPVKEFFMDYALSQLLN